MTRALLLVLSLLLLPMLSVQGQDAPETTDRPPLLVKWTYGLFGGAFKADLTLYQGGARDAAGEIVVTVKDRLTHWNGRAISNRDQFTLELFGTKPGEIVEITFERPNPDKKARRKKPTVTRTASVKLGDPAKRYADLYHKREARTRTWNWQNSEAATRQDLLRKRVGRLLEQHKLTGAWDRLRAAHARELDLWDCYESTGAVELLLQDPLSAHTFTKGVTDEISRAFRFDDQEFSQLAAPIAKLLDRSPPSSASGGKPGLVGALEVLDTLAAAFDSDMAKRIREFDYAWSGEAGREKSVTVVKGLRTGKAPAVAALAGLDSVLGKILEVAPQLQPGTIQTRFGTIGIGGPGRDVWDCAKNHYALIVDLGGDDIYTGYCGAPAPGKRVGVIVDLGGNDSYSSNKRFGVGAAPCGIGLIYDVAGDDTYTCGEWALGAAFNGLGLIVDREGNDRYLGGDYSIGCAAYGIGGVIDLAGNDIYDSHIHSIGSGLPGGVGFVLDKGGDDRYRCGGKYGSGYGTKGEYTGWGIGCGFGFRGLAAGGTGLVVDCGGNDIYDAGEFGLGCGYFLGIGIVRDLKGDDIYHSSRYGLAAAAHCAVGLFMDDGGHDTYEGKTAASMAGVWDIVTGYFYEGAGNDIYRCNGLGLGACSQNGAGIFWDRQGNDIYRGSKNTLGNAGDTAYGGGRLAPNFGIFLDTGGKDSYPRDNRENGKNLVEKRYALFVDE